MRLSLARGFFPAAVLALLPLAVLAQTPPDPAPVKAPDPVVATVNGTAIHRSDIEAARQDLPAQYQSFPYEVVFPALLERLIDGKLLTAEGRKAGLAKDPEVKLQLARVEDQVILSVYLARAVKAKLTDEVLRARYQEFLKNNGPEPERRVRHILVKTEEEAKDAIKALQGGTDFAELAKKLSTGPSAPQGGDLGYVKRGDVVPEFAEAAFALKSGSYTETAVKTQFGWHVIKVEDVRDSKPPSFEEAKDELERSANRDMIAEVVGALRTKAAIVRFNADGTPRSESEAKPGADQTKKPE